MANVAKITIAISVQVDLKDDTHFKITLDDDKTTKDVLAETPVYITHTGYRRTGGDFVEGKLMSYGETVIKHLRVVDISSSKWHLLCVDPSNGEEQVVGLGDCSKIRSTLLEE